MVTASYLREKAALTSRSTLASEIGGGNAKIIIIIKKKIEAVTEKPLLAHSGGLVTAPVGWGRLGEWGSYTAESVASHVPAHKGVQALPHMGS